MNTESRELYEKLISGQIDGIIPRSRIEAYLMAIINVGVKVVSGGGSGGGGGGDASLAPGLYQTGAIALYEEQGASAVEGMMIKSWDELVAEGAIMVDNGAVSAGRVLPDNMPELNEYGFYYGVPYTQDGYCLTFYEDGSYEDGPVDDESSIIQHPANVAVYSSKSVYLSDWDQRFSVSSNGMRITDVNDEYWFYNLGDTAMLAGDLIMPNNNNIVSIGNSAFRQNSLTNVIIPDSVTSIGGYAFHKCEALSSVIIPGSVKTIGYEAFGYCIGLANATIAEGGECIGEYAFENSFKVGFTPGSSALYLPSTITEIQSRAFSQTALTDVYYNGTCDQFRAINRAGDSFYYNSKVVIHCTDGDYDWT